VLKADTGGPIKLEEKDCSGAFRGFRMGRGRISSRQPPPARLPNSTILCLGVISVTSIRSAAERRYPRDRDENPPIGR
jgi:hypothetical protein